MPQGGPTGTGRRQAGDPWVYEERVLGPLGRERGCQLVAEEARRARRGRVPENGRGVEWNSMEDEESGENKTG